MGFDPSWLDRSPKFRSYDSYFETPEEDESQEWDLVVEELEYQNRTK